MRDDQYDFRKAPKTRSIWDPDVDYNKVMKLPPDVRGRLFPNDFDHEGKPRGDF